MPIIVSSAAAASTTALADAGLMSYGRAKRLVARTIGGETKTTALEESGDAILQALSELDMHEWDFLRKTTSQALTASTADYTLPNGCDKIYTVRLSSNARPLAYVDQRDYDRLTYQQTESTPVAYTIFPSTAVEALDPQHAYQSIRFIPTPSSADTAVIKYYRLTAIIVGDGDTLDLPRQFQYWPIYQAKAMLLMDHGDRRENAMYWQKMADRMLWRMVAQDQEHPDQDTAFGSSRDRVGAYDVSHPQHALWVLDGF